MSMKDEDDLPKSIIVILVVLAVAISILGTFTVVNEVRSANLATEYRGQNEQSAKVSLEIVDPNAGMVSTTGKITFTYVSPEVN